MSKKSTTIFLYSQDTHVDLRNHTIVPHNDHFMLVCDGQNVMLGEMSHIEEFLKGYGVSPNVP